MSEWDAVTFNADYPGSDAFGDELDAVSEAEVARTPGLLQADAAFAKRMGGSFVAEAVSRVEAIGLTTPLIVDTKIHMLKDGWYPGIPGWHVDFAPDWTNVVNWSRIDPAEQHFMAVSHPVSLTEFVGRPLTLSLPRIPRINGLLSRIVEAYAFDGDLPRATVRPRRLYRFGQLDLHRVAPALGSGWRLFVRISATRLRTPLNQVRAHDSQVYITNPNAGW